MADIAELGIRVDSKGVQQGAKDLKDLSGAAGEAEKKANAMGKAIGAAVAALSVGAIVNWTKETTRAIAELDRFARLSGTTAEEFQKVAYASARFGVEQEKLADILKDTNDKFGDFFQTGAGPLVDFFEQVAPRVGITADAFRGLSGPDALGLYVKTLQEAGVNQQDMTFYLEALASDATLLQGVFEDGSAALAMYSAEAERLGLVLSGSTIAQAREFQNQLTTLDAILTNTSQNVAAEMLPALNDLMGLLIELNAESDAMATVGETLGVVFKGLASAAVVVGAAFKVAGDNIGAVAASAAAAADGNFSGAFEILKNRPGEALETIEAAFTRIDRLWDGSAAKTAEAAGKMERSVRQWERIDTPAKEKAAKATAALTDRIGEQIAQLEFQAATVGMTSDQVTLLKLSLDGATEAQLAQATAALGTVAAYEAQAKAAEDAQRALDKRKDKFGDDPRAAILGNVTPLSGGPFDDQQARFDAERQAEERRYAEQQMRLQEALELELITRQQYADLEVEMRQVTADRIAQIEMARNDMMLTSAASAFGQMSSDIMAFAQLFGEEQKEMFAIAKAAAIAQTIIQTYQGAQQAFTSLSAIPIVGPALGAAAAAAAVAGGLARVSAISSQSPSFDGGGYTGNGSRTGGVDGKGGFWAVMHPQETVIDHTKGQSAPGGGGVITNNFIVTGRPDMRTQAQIAQSASVAQRRTTARLGK